MPRRSLLGVLLWLSIVVIWKSIHNRRSRLSIFEEKFHFKIMKMKTIININIRHYCCCFLCNFAIRKRGQWNDFNRSTIECVISYSSFSLLLLQFIRIWINLNEYSNQDRTTQPRKSLSLPPESMNHATVKSVSISYKSITSQSVRFNW